MIEFQCQSLTKSQAKVTVRKDRIMNKNEIAVNDFDEFGEVEIEDVEKLEKMEMIFQMEEIEDTLTNTFDW